MHGWPGGLDLNKLKTMYLKMPTALPCWTWLSVLKQLNGQFHP
jgi:hypothetical protein